MTAAASTTGTQSGTADQCHCQSVTSCVAVFWLAYRATPAPATIRSSRNRIMSNPSRRLWTMWVSRYLTAAFGVKAGSCRRVAAALTKRVAKVAQGGGGQKAGGQREGREPGPSDQPAPRHRQAERQGGAEGGAQAGDQPERPPPSSGPGEQDAQ